MSSAKQEYDPRYCPRPPFKSGEAVYMTTGEIFHVVSVRWSLEHKQWQLELKNPDEDNSLAKVFSAFGLLTKREFFLRKVKP